MLTTLALLLAFAHPSSLINPVTPHRTQLATFIPVCRDGRGGWDRRACRHMRHNDPARLTLAYQVNADAPSAIG